MAKTYFSVGNYFFGRKLVGTAMHLFFGVVSTTRDSGSQTN